MVKVDFDDIELGMELKSSNSGDIYRVASPASVRLIHLKTGCSSYWAREAFNEAEWGLMDNPLNSPFELEKKLKTLPRDDRVKWIDALHKIAKHLAMEVIQEVSEEIMSQSATSEGKK